VPSPDHWNSAAEIYAHRNGMAQRYLSGSKFYYGWQKKYKAGNKGFFNREKSFILWFGEAPEKVRCLRAAACQSGQRG
jgi:hypothetical protein